MDWIPRLLAITSTALAFIAFGGDSADTPVLPTPLPLTTLISVPDASQGTQNATPTTAAIAVIPPTARCGQWWGLATQVGWTEADLPTLDYVLWKESRCDPAQHNTTLNKDGSSDMGLTQINDRSWCLPTRWYPDGYLQTLGILTTVGCDQLFDPATNLTAAKAIYDYSRETNGNGWKPWSIKGPNGNP